MPFKKGQLVIWKGRCNGMTAYLPFKVRILEIESGTALYAKIKIEGQDLTLWSTLKDLEVHRP